MKKVIIIVGPTGSGKTELSLKLYNMINTEIISADSMQIYREMNIGTAKATEDILDKYKHHMVNIIDPSDSYSVADYQKDTFMIIDSLINDNKIPIVVGGTGLYINSLVYNLDFNSEKPNEELRDTLWNAYEENGQEYILNILKEIDLDSYNNIEHNNIKRIIRAIEVYKTTGTPYSKQNKSFREENTNYSFYIYGLTDKRELLYNRINKRVEKMVDLGLFEEVKYLMEKYNTDSQAFKAIGYKEIVDYFDGVYDKETSIEKLKQNSRKYAKRQLTWFNRDSRINWFNLSEYNYDEIANIIYREVMND